MRFVMLAEQNLGLESFETLADVVAHPELVAEPQRERRQVGLEAARRAGDVGFEQAGKLDERLLVKADEIDLAGA